MSPFKRPFTADEELGKKDDDHRPQAIREPLWRSKQWRAPRPRRFIVVVIAVYLLYLFFKNMPTDIPPAVERFNPGFAQGRRQSGRPWPPSITPPATSAQKPPPRDASTKQDRTDFYYEGDIKFNALPKSLQRFWKPPARYGNTASHAVVFAASSLRSVSDLLPLACRMAEQRVNEVHFVLMGRDDVSIEGIQRVNGIDEIACLINWHDGRPNYAPWSTEARMEKAVAAALGHIQLYTRPQALITQGDSWEDHFFMSAVQMKAQEISLTHISLPSPARDVMWMSMLDSDALKAWNDVHIELLIQASPESSGSLIRLIRSLAAADYLGSIPSLTIELPPRVDPQLLHFLQKMRWPPQTSSKVTLRHRIRPHHLDAAEASLRTAEAFYPRDPNMTHVLLLNQQVELAPSFYHYLKYTMLKYKHSNQVQHAPSKLLGISLELPSSQVTNDEPFKLPEFDMSSHMSQLGDGGVLPIFLWQAPNSNAALYFGDGWAEFHSFLSNRFTIHDPTSKDPPDEQVISKKYPAVMEYLLEMIRARGYYLLYPAFPAQGSFPLATVHSESYQPPEEFADDILPNTPETSADSEVGRRTEKPLHQISTLMPLLDRFSINLPDLSSLPLLSYRGESISDAIYAKDIEEYTKRFRTRYGGCQDGNWKADSSPGLFCSSDLVDVA
ncbi:uncharacterized protein ACLA_014770 [Aspergillus clavatus NRRL 1]|uniref:Glycosyltransferase 2 n=1 Tax=Aspergillus clavatus (strain ATCC 1007 / CBS 513.65 / DSM 816 / NCTC 3887 / NRRL 1 / QM 1276 / 107) TaxID=344612 RepID=A1CBC2_ASPCL|nr:uncharacterized protein ACLA_014770 [Aspergillus clavatus NRRL 1]EAW13040.1 conserved hypothetical protein [Aspergillus clavatus NRRL 1]